MIKKLENSDIKIAEKIRSVFQVSYAVEAKLLEVPDFPPLKRSLESYLKNESQFFGYLINQEIAGVIEIVQNNDSIHIDSLVVNPKFFRQGIAGKLIEFVFKSFDSKIFIVETGVKNLPATELYRKHGFKEVKQWDTDHGIRKIRFERKEENENTTEKIQSQNLKYLIANNKGKWLRCMKNIDLIFENEFNISSDTSKEINALLKKSFPGTKYENRDYYKQLPHYRILARKEKRLIGQLGIDFRVMNLNDQAINVFGVVDLCVDPKYRRKGIGRLLMERFEKIAKDHPNKIDFLFLVTDTPNYYKNMGFSITDITTTWLKIDQHKNYGIGKERRNDASFLIKNVSNKQWKDGELDLLGYMY